MIRNGEAGESDQLILYRRAANGAAEKMSGAHVHTCPQAHTHKHQQETEKETKARPSQEKLGDHVRKLLGLSGTTLLPWNYMEDEVFMSENSSI